MQRVHRVHHRGGDTAGCLGDELRFERQAVTVGVAFRVAAGLFELRIHDIAQRPAWLARIHTFDGDAVHELRIGERVRAVGLVPELVLEIQDLLRHRIANAEGDVVFHVLWISGETLAWHDWWLRAQFEDRILINQRLALVARDELLLLLGLDLLPVVLLRDLHERVEKDFVLEALTVTVNEAFLARPGV